MRLKESTFDGYHSIHKAMGGRSLRRENTICLVESVHGELQSINALLWQLCGHGNIHPKYDVQAGGQQDLNGEVAEF